MSFAAVTELTWGLGLGSLSLGSAVELGLESGPTLGSWPGTSLDPGVGPDLGPGSARPPFGAT